MSPNEIIWNPERKTHEELCKRCRTDGESGVFYSSDFYSEEGQGEEDPFFEESN